MVGLELGGGSLAPCFGMLRYGHSFRIVEDRKEWAAIVHLEMPLFFNNLTSSIFAIHREFHRNGHSLATDKIGYHHRSTHLLQASPPTNPSPPFR